MADKEKKVAPASDVEKATADESKAAEKVAKAAKGNANKNSKPNFFVRSGKAIKTFFKDFKGECKKIVWPDAKTVLKSTGVVLLVVAIVSVVVYGIDQALTAGIEGLESLATAETTVEEDADTDADTDAEAEDETDADADEDEEADEETTEAEDDDSSDETAEDDSTDE